MQESLQVCKPLEIIDFFFFLIKIKLGYMVAGHKSKTYKYILS